MANLPEIPKLLTSSEWGKKKTVIAKIVARKTGISEALDALKPLLKPIAVEMSAAELMVANGVAVIRKATPFDDLREGPFKVLSDALDEVRDLADSWAEKWKPKTNPVPAKVREYVVSISEAAEDYKKAIETVIDEAEDAALDLYETEKSQVLKAAKETLKVVVGKVKATKEALTPDVYNEQILGSATAAAANGAGRSLSTALRRIEQFMGDDAPLNCVAYRKLLSPFGDGTDKLAPNDASREEVKQLLDEFKQIVAEIGAQLNK